MKQDGVKSNLRVAVNEQVLERLGEGRHKFAHDNTHEGTINWLEKVD